MLIKNKYLIEWINYNYSTMIEDGDSCLCELDYFDMDKFADWLVKKLSLCDVVSSATKCNHKKYKVRRTYIKWFEFAERQRKKGYKQEQCNDCKLWFFPSEM